jgi:hypothetical protein
MSILNAPFEAMRATIILSCLIATTLGTAAIFSHRWALQGVVFWVGCVWTLADVMASGMYRRSYWKAHDIPISQIYHDIKQGRESGLPRRGTIERVTRVGSITLIIIFIALYFV